jgi:hypothetical protein
LTAKVLVILPGLHFFKPLFAPAFALNISKGFSRAGVGVAFAVSVFYHMGKPPFSPKTPRHSRGACQFYVMASRNKPRSVRIAF